MATFAHFGDQNGNEEIIVNRGYGVKLNNNHLFFAMERYTFMMPQFSARDVTRVFNTLLNDPKYLIAIKKAQA